MTADPHFEALARKSLAAAFHSDGYFAYAEAVLAGSERQYDTMAIRATVAALAEYAASLHHPGSKPMATVAPIARAPLSTTLAAFEQIRDGNSDMLKMAGRHDAADANRRIADNMIRGTLDLARALKDALAGDFKGAREIAAALDLDGMEIR